MEFIELIKRHAVSKEVEEVTVCEDHNEYDGANDNLRILAVFMILISSGLGSFFPILSSRYSFIRLPDWCFFIAKFFGSGVITATAFIHLLEPAVDELGNECLGGTLGEYPWAFAICLMSIFSLFLVELLTHHFMSKNGLAKESEHGHDDSNPVHFHEVSSCSDNDSKKNDGLEHVVTQVSGADEQIAAPLNSIIGTNHFSHDANHQDIEQLNTPAEQQHKEKYHTQLLSIFILEFGIIFHSIFVGLSLAVSGDEFKTLFVVIIFHQMFEGLGLGSRLAEINWRSKKAMTPWFLALGFTLTTPIAIGIGIGVRHSYNPGSRTGLIASGVFDAISAGILIYTGLVELMAHEFLFSNQFKGENGLKKMLFAYVTMCCGCALMALLGKWA